MDMTDRTCTVDGCAQPHYSRGMCKPHYRRDYYLRNRERENANFRAWRDANLQAERDRWVAYYQQNADRLSVAKAAAYYANHEANLARYADYRRRNPGRHKVWREANPEKWALLNRENQRRRRRVDGAPVNYADLLAEHGMVCHICGGAIPSLADLHFDHVIPLSKGGLHVPENVRPSHAVCNLRKSDRITT